MSDLWVQIEHCFEVSSLRTSSCLVNVSPTLATIHLGWVGVCGVVENLHHNPPLMGDGQLGGRAHDESSRRCSCSKHWARLNVKEHRIMARKKTVRSTPATELGVTGFFGGVNVLDGVLEPESAKELMLARIEDRDPELVSKCECCVAFNLMLGVSLVPQSRNGVAAHIRQHMHDGAVSCGLHNGRVSCCRAVQAWNEGVTGSSARNGHPLTFRP